MVHVQAKVVEKKKERRRSHEVEKSERFIRERRGPALS